MAQPSPSTPHHRHQSSLEGIINFQPKLPLSSPTRNRARRRFFRFTDHFDLERETQSSGNMREYNRAKLLRLTYDHARSSLSQDIFLRAFFTFLELPLDGDGDDGDDGDGDSDERMRDSGPRDETSQLIKNLVRYALACEYSRTPIRRDGIKDKGTAHKYPAGPN